MKRSNIGFIAAAFVLIFVICGSNAVGQSVPPRSFVDREMCPGESCEYKSKKAKVVAETRVYSSPTTASASVFVLKLGTMVTGIDSLVRTTAGHFRVKRQHKKYRRGDLIYVYTYLGEGYFRVWYGGKMIEEDLAFSVWGGSSGERCESDPKNCWGILKKRTDMKWWLKIRTNDGKKGWILVDKNLHWLDTE